MPGSHLPGLASSASTDEGFTDVGAIFNLFPADPGTEICEIPGVGIIMSKGGLRAVGVRVPVYRRVLAATDFSPLGNSAIPHAYALLAARGGTVILCHVVETAEIPNPLYAHYTPGRTPSPEERRKLRQASVQALNRLVAPEVRKKKTVRTEVRVVEAAGPVHEAICQEAKDQGVDLIVMASHGHSGLTRLFLGSVAERVLRSIECPMLIVRGA